MTSFEITDEQKSFFDEFGFLVFRQLFSPEEMETIGREAQATFDAVYTEGRAGGSHGRWVTLMGPQTPFNACLLEDERVYTIARRTFDESLIGLNVDMLEWYADTGWHRDQDVPGNTGLKLIYYMEPLTAESGSLRVVPGSHIEPHEKQVPEIEPLRITADDGDYMNKISELEIGQGDVMLPSVAVESRPGDVVAFAMPLLHAAFGGRRGRRFGATVYWYPSSTKEHADLRRREAAIIRSNHAKMFNYPEDAPYCHPHWIAEAEGNPTRTRWVECLRDLEWIRPDQ